MSGLSLVIKNARIVDGTGKPAYPGDVGLAGDRIAAIGRIDDGHAAPEIDAGGHALAPGFIDIHTHYDPQLCWDRLATPSPEHGVTTLVIGNCSVNLAPVKPAHRAKVISLFGSVEDMESSLLENTIPFSWESFDDYLDYLKHGLGPNVGCFIGHAILRLYVMGEDSQKRIATDVEIAAMCKIFRDALNIGALGLSFTTIHRDELGAQLPCAYADRRELLALFQVMAKEGRGLVEAIPFLIGTTEQALASVDAFGALALETGVTCSLSPIVEHHQASDLWLRLLSRFQEWQARGAPLFAQTQVRPFDSTFRLSKGAAHLSKSPSWRKIFELPIDDRIEAFRDLGLRPALSSEVTPNARATNKALTVKRGYSVASRKYEGRHIGEIAVEEGKEVTDVLIDLALEDRLETEFSLTGVRHADVGAVLMLLNHPAIHVGAADAGAHINQFSGAGDTSYLLEKFVRQERGMSIERAVQRLTSDIARAWKIKDRGEIAESMFADLVIFDPDTVARGEEEWVEDVPGGSGRYVRHATGYDKVLVNGEVLIDQGSYTNARTGRII